MRTVSNYSDAEDGFPFPFSPYNVQLDVMRAVRRTVLGHRVGVLESPTGTGKSQILLNGVLSTVFPPQSRIEHGDHDLRTKRGRTDGSFGPHSSRRHNKAKKRWQGGAKPRKRGVDTDPEMLVQSDNEDSGRRQGSCLSSSSSDSDKRRSSSSSDDDDDPRTRPLAHPKVYFCSRTHTQLSQLTEEFRKTVFSRHNAASASTPQQQSGGATAEYPTLPFIHLASRLQLCINGYLRGGGGSSPSLSSKKLNDLCKDALQSNRTKEGRVSIKEFWRRRGDANGVGITDLEDLVRTAQKTNATGGGGGGATSSHATANHSGCILCPFAQPSRLKVLKDYARASSRTLDEFVTLGKAVGACPFLATKDLVREANVVFLPYSYVVDPIAREQLLPEDMFVVDNDDGVEGVGGSLEPPAASCVVGGGAQLAAFRGNVIVFDEAHHVADTARHNLCHTVAIEDMEIVASLLDTYSARFESKLLSKNKAKLRELGSFCRKLIAYVHRVLASSTLNPSSTASTTQGASTLSSQQQHQQLLPLSDLLFDAGVDYVNPMHLAAFFDDTRLVFKLPSQAAHAVMHEAVAVQRHAVHASQNGGSAGASMQHVKRTTSVWTSVAGDLAPFLLTALTPATAAVGAAAASNLLGERLRVRLHDAAQRATTSVSTLLRVLATIAAEDCVVIVSPSLSEEQRGPDTSAPGGGGGATMRFVALRGACTMASVFHSASSVLFAGGTMQPLPMLVDSLLPTNDDEDVNNNNNNNAGVPNDTVQQQAAAPRLYDAYSFPHVIPSTSLRVVTLGSGPSGRPLEFTFAQRSQLAEQLEDASRCVVNLARVIPHGLIICFTSYAMEDSFFQRAATTGILDQLNTIKRVFREQRSTSSASSPSGGGTSSEDVLEAYRRWIEQGLEASRTKGTTGSGGGALLSCVMGGKLSEGINFNDHLGRGVIVVGLPYPNPHDVELKLLLQAAALSPSGCPGAIASRTAGSRARETIAAVQQNGNSSSSGGSSSRTLYQQVCMRSVNQAMGRCIRHIGDYAVVVLLDARFQRPEVAHHVSGWMKPSMSHAANFGECFRSVREFFADRSDAAATAAASPHTAA